MSKKSTASAAAKRASTPAVEGIGGRTPTATAPRRTTTSHGTAVEGIGGRPAPGTAAARAQTTNNAAAAAATTAASATTTAPAAASTAAAAPVSPYLTPAQQLALGNWNTTYGEDIANLGLSDSNALTKYNVGMAADTLKNAETVDATNQAEAARGMFQSSIRAGALNDLAATLAQQTNVLQTNYNTSMLKDQSSRVALSGKNSYEQTYYNELGVGNAQSITPAVTPTTGTGTTGTGAAGATTPGQPAVSTAPGTTAAEHANTPQVSNYTAATPTTRAATARIAAPKPAAEGIGGRPA